MQSELFKSLRNIVGYEFVYTRERELQKYCTGYRLGFGKAVAAVRPGSLIELWRVVQCCVAQNAPIIVQAANTGLTGGSAPFGDYDRDIVVANTMRLSGIEVIKEGREVVCFPGSTLYELERKLAPYNRAPHSEIGSSCIGASVMGGICNNSGGALVQRGPAYTEAALFAQVEADGSLVLHNHLGIELGEDAEQMLSNLQSGNFQKFGPSIVDKVCSSLDYCSHVSDLAAPSPARYNADERGLYEASGSAGKVIVFAARVATFEKPESTHVFYLGTNEPDELTESKSKLMVEEGIVPISGEYIHSDMFQIATKFGKDMFIAIKLLGTDRLPFLFNLKTRIDRLTTRLKLPVSHPSDRLMQFLGRFWPQHLSKRLKAFSSRYEHHLLLKVDGTELEKVREVLSAQFQNSDGAFLECSSQEAADIFLQRFVAAGAAIRYDVLESGKQRRLVAVDVALRRNDRDWANVLPEHLVSQTEQMLVYGHFFCNVFHLDFIVKPGVNPHKFEEHIIDALASKGAECPAEHNVGHLYKAKPTLLNHYKSLDPTNFLNPGIGKSSKRAHWES